MALTKRGYNLKVKLLKEGKTQAWLAKQLGVKRQLLSNCIFGESNLRLEEAIDHYIETGEIEYAKDNSK